MVPDWRRLCGLSVQLCGGQEAFRREARILKRLVTKFGAQETEVMLRGALGLGWKGLTCLGSAEGIGRRWARQAYWDKTKRAPSNLPGSVKDVLREMVR